jgi:hypothetical protein
MNGLYQFLSGAAMVGAWASGVFFFRFWRRTRDRLFLYFGVSFWAMAVERVCLAIPGDPNGEDRSLFYVIRLFAFGLIIYAIADKNRAERRAACPR